MLTIFIYGGRLFFYSLAPDDYARFYDGGGEQASWLGRWSASIINQNIFTGSTHILPYINGLLGVFSFTLSGFLTAKFFNRSNILEISIVTLLIAVSPFVAHNLHFSTNISAWLMTLFGVIGLILAYKQSILLKILGLLFLATAIGSYQTIIQITVAMVATKAMIDILEANSLQDLKDIAVKAFSYIGFILLAFALSMLINELYLKYFHLSAQGRYVASETMVKLSALIGRIENMYSDAYNLSLGLLYFQSKLSFLYYSSVILGSFGGFIFLIKKNISKETKFISILLLIVLLMSIPLIINLPLVTGMGMRARAHFTIGWILSGLFILQMISYRGIVKSIALLTSISIIIVSVYYINVFFDAASRQTNADIIRAKEIVNRIRSEDYYAGEPLKLRIVGKASYAVIGWGLADAFSTNWSKYGIFKYFTDLNFIKMNDDEYLDAIKFIADNNLKIKSYPARNSIVLFEDKAVLFLNKNDIEGRISKYKFENATEKKLLVKSKFDIYLVSNELFYIRHKCRWKYTHNNIFLNVYPVNTSDLPPDSQKEGFQKINISLYRYGFSDENICMVAQKLPGFQIKKIDTGQYNESKIDWHETIKVVPVTQDSLSGP